MIIVIPYRTANSQPADHEELRHALRSICLQHQVEDCILVGGRPDWYTGRHLPHADYAPQHKEQNIRDTVALAAAWLDEPFLFANDDHYLLAPLACDWDKGPLSDTLASRKNPNGSYSLTLKNTLARYGDVPDVDTHCPLLMHPETVKQVAAQDWPQWGLGFKTAYAQAAGLRTLTIPDCKINDWHTGVLTRPWFSTGRWLPELKNIFPEPCKFEK
jgi:hypothetical protein